MKKLLLVAIVLVSALSVKAQAQKYLNFGGLGTGLYVGLELPLGSAITIVPQASTNYNFDNLYLAVKGNYYFDALFGLPEAWDVYAGANLGWRIDNSNDNNNNDGFGFGGQIGGRWFWSSKWGLNAEFGWGGGAIGGLGVTMKM